MILLQAVGGLCNRMLAIDSALAIATKMNKKLTVLWEDHPLMNCMYSDLFQPSSVFQVIDKKRNFYLLRQVEKTINYLKFDKFIYTRTFEKLRTSSFSFLELSHYGNIYICGYNRFYPESNIGYSLTPITRLQKEIDSKSAVFNRKTIGLHIRRRDHLDAIQISTTNKFIQKMNEELELNTETNFFLATDDPAEELILKKQFGEGKIISFKKELSRNKTKGQQDALVDLYCLANTSKIYGSFESSFSATAAEINNIPIIIIQ